ncbi:conserved hypothetical protein [Weissella viridescens]|uniref:Uncharacterized protein conserved in bacteria n=1 Tax=Weissella viridescens TaxID=1629 RepID=A0A0R2GZF0_WEIVI|nr:DUF1054 family protein [Weissella viridescens]KRN45832.1 hypothetical protein IV50_GL001420 [Weissella viridescens]MBX4173409.1 DUF1054 domain-containing protein [Weissella viridescens]SOB43937.1 conserved hypothetical protein [Weissella viridescens]SUP52235.1 Uncharacterized protein conserved in bacteria [Weissella viridescens]GEA95233.1 UPF0637 protein [Weissella viridescens]
MFNNQDFRIFEAPTLAERMQLIQQQIDPKFEDFAKLALPILEEDGQAWYAHVAKHLRRTVYPPDNTWVAFAPNKRGYKMLPHFELGLWDDCLYLYLSFLENLKQDATQQALWTERIQAQQSHFLDLPQNFVISPNHMEPAVISLDATNFERTVMQFGQKKHTEFSVGLRIAKGDPRFGTADLDYALCEALRKLQNVYECIRVQSE